MDPKHKHIAPFVKPPAKKPPTKQPLRQEGCLPAQTLDEIRQEMREKFPGITDDELDAMGC